MISSSPSYTFKRVWEDLGPNLESLSMVLNFKSTLSPPTWSISSGCDWYEDLYHNPKFEEGYSGDGERKD